MTIEGAPSGLSAYEDETPRETQWWKNGGLYLGYATEAPTDAAHPLRSEWKLTGETRHYRQDRHVLTIGPNGSGKTRRLLYPNLYRLKDWSVVAIDPKAELFAHTVIERAKAPDHRIMLIDPFGVAKATYPKLAERFADAARGFNPLACLEPRGESEKALRFVDDAKSLAVALIKADDARDKYWPQAAQALVKGLLMAMRLRSDKASLVGLRDVLGLTPADLATYIRNRLRDVGTESPPVTASLGEFVTFSADDKEIGGIRRTAKVQTDWLDSPQMRACLEGDGFDFATLKETPTTVYLVLPPEFLATHGVWLRLMVASILRPLLRSVNRPRVPVLFMLDEFAQLGRMEIIEDNYALMRGYGVKLWTIWQDLNQAKNLYRERWESFVSNAGMVQSFAPQDMTTRQYLSKLADERLTWHTRPASSGGLSVSKGGAAVNAGDSKSDTHVKEPLMYPYELGQMGQGQSVLFNQRGLVRRVYFPDASAMPGVRDMMAEAAPFCA